jgi:vacuolar protein sorting-associated protein 16
MSQKKNEILRRLPDHFINIFQTLSTQPGAMLYTAYEQFEQRNPIEDDGLRSRKSELKTAVEDCIYAG